MDNLKASLSSLHGNLASAGPVDDELRDLLRQLDGDIQQLLARRAAEGLAPGEGEGDSVVVPVPGTVAADAPATTTYGLAERTQEISARFAARHPQLEPALRELGNILSSMGI